MFHVTCDLDGGACGGVSGLAKDGIPYSDCTLNTSLQAKAVTISISKTITICSLYLPSSENLNIVMLTRLIDQLPAPFLFVVTLMVIACLGVVTKTIVGEIELMTLLLITMYVYLMMVLIHISTQLQEHSHLLIFLFVHRTFLWRLISW